MLVTEFAMMDPGPAGDSILSRCLRAVSHFFGFGSAHPEPHAMYREPARTYAALPGDDTTSRLHIVPDQEPTLLPIISHKWRRHEQLLDRPTSILPHEERQARHHAVQGLYAARAGALEAAEEYFTQAAICPDIDLCEIPGFWQLHRPAMMTAVRAYEANGRLREASALNARIRTNLRPRALSPVPENITELSPKRPMSLSGNS